MATTASPKASTAGPRLISSIIRSAAPFGRRACWLASNSAPLEYLNEPAALGIGSNPRSTWRYLVPGWKMALNIPRSALSGLGSRLDVSFGGNGTTPWGLKPTPGACANQWAASVSNRVFPVPGGPVTRTFFRRRRASNTRTTAELGPAPSDPFMRHLLGHHSYTICRDPQG